VTIDRDGIRRLLVIKLRAVGDVLLSTVVTRNLRLAFPNASIDFLTEPPSRDILAGNPHIDSTIVYDRSAMSSAGLILLVRKSAYDLVIDLFGNPRTALITRLSGARFRVGYRFRWRTYAYNILVEPRGGEVHNTQFNLDALSAIGVGTDDRRIYFQFARSDEDFVDEFLARANLQGKFLVGLSFGGGWYTKRWDLDRFARLADRLVEELGAHIVLTWGPGQLSQAEQVSSMMIQKGFIPPATTLKQLGALLRRCSIVVSNDSGPMHIAAAVGTPVLGIFGPTNPKLQGPYGESNMTVQLDGLECLGCNLTKCPIGHRCMVELSVEVVMAHVQKLLSKQTVRP
jgi:heptosyltransferase-3